MCYGDVLKHVEVYGLDAGDALEELDGFDEEKLSVGKYVTAVALTTFHGLYLMELDAEKEGSKLPPTLPLSFNASRSDAGPGEKFLAENACLSTSWRAARRRR
jgi:hypothetical protein